MITKLMKERFPKIVNVKFTAQMETELDEVEQGRLEQLTVDDGTDHGGTEVRAGRG